MKVKDIMTVNPEFVDIDDSVASAAGKMKQLNVGFMPVRDRGQVAGIVTDRDITTRLAAEHLDPDRTAVGDIMSPRVIYCKEDMDIEQAAQIMEHEQLHRLLVRNDEGEFVGVLSLGDLAMTAGRELVGEVVRDISGISAPQR
ncbi:MAG: CBS domain-containing protein [Chitinivibrionales bacterium]|nr:CBS domain-containing protein [Chitinivibrionales bacterium]